MTQRHRRRAERVARRTSAQSRAGLAVSCSACLPLATSAHLSASSTPVWTAARASPKRTLLPAFASCDKLGRDPAAVPGLPTEQRSGHEPTVTRLGVEEPRSGRWRRPTQTCLRCRTRFFVPAPTVSECAETEHAQVTGACKIFANDRARAEVCGGLELPPAVDDFHN
jgi:hypothetical protein